MVAESEARRHCTICGLRVLGDGPNMVHHVPGRITFAMSDQPTHHHATTTDTLVLWMVFDGWR